MYRIGYAVLKVSSCPREEHRRPAGTPMHRAHLSTASPSASSLVGTRYRPAQGLCVIWKKVTHRPDGHRPTLIPQPTPAQLHTATLTPGKSPRFVGKGKADACILHQAPSLGLPQAFHPILAPQYPSWMNLGPLTPSVGTCTLTVKGSGPALPNQGF